MEDMSNIMANKPDKESTDEANPSTQSMIGSVKQLTGLDLDPTKSIFASAQKPATPTIKKKENAEVELTPAHNAGDDVSFITAKDMKERGMSTTGTDIDVAAELEKARDEQYERVKREDDNSLINMFQDTLREQEERIERLDNTLNSDEETREELLGPTPKNVVTNSVEVSYKEREKASRTSTNPAFDPEDLMPSYDDDEEEEKDPKAEEEEPNPSNSDYGEYIRGLEHAEVAYSDKNAVTHIRQANLNVATISSGRNKTTNLGDQAFLNAINRYKKDNFGKVTVPMVNSGFLVDVVGSGVVDIQNLYINVDRNTSTYDYQLEQMRTVIKNVVGTFPKVSKQNLQNMIHFQDFQMLAYGHICATMEKIETVANCTECGKPFRITSDSTSLLINQDELYERRTQIENAMDIEAYSLMTHNKEVTTESGIIVVLGHPSYAEIIRCIRGFQTFSENMSNADRRRFEGMLTLLYMIRKVILPNGVASNNIYQSYMSLMLLSQADLEVVNKQAEAMRKEILVPKFGVKEVTCPHCGRVVKDIAYDNLLELLFYHTTVSSYLMENVAPKSSDEQ